MRRQENSDLKVIINLPSLLRCSAKLLQVVRFVSANPLAQPVAAQKNHHLGRSSRSFPVARVDRYFSVYTSAENKAFSKNNTLSVFLKLHYTQPLPMACKHVTALERPHAFPFE